jgi:hypothetical protein
MLTGHRLSQEQRWKGRPDRRSRPRIAERRGAFWVDLTTNIFGMSFEQTQVMPVNTCVAVKANWPNGTSGDVQITPNWS